MSNYITKEVTIDIENDSVIWDIMRQYYETDDEEEKKIILSKASALLMKRIEDKIYG